MKKIIGASLLAAMAAPSLSVAIGVCGFPPQSNPSFCSCFINASVATCQSEGPKHGISPNLCSTSNIYSTIKNTRDVSGYCRTYHYMIPAGVDLNECAADMQFAQSHC